MPLRLRPTPFDQVTTIDALVSSLATKGLAFSDAGDEGADRLVSGTRAVPIQLATQRGRISTRDRSWGWSVLLMRREERWLVDLRDESGGPTLNRVRSGRPVRRFETACAAAEGEGLSGFVEVLRIPELAVEALRVIGPPVRYVVPDPNDPARANILSGIEFRKWLRPRRAALLSAITPQVETAVSDVTDRRESEIGR